MTNGASGYAARYAAARDFVAELRKLRDEEELGILAALRRGLGRSPGHAAEMYPHVEPHLPDGLTLSEQNDYYLVATLFAWHQIDWPRSADPSEPSDFGASFAELRNPADPTRADSTQARFQALLNCRKEVLWQHLRQAVGLLRTNEVPIHWTRLLMDIQQWGALDRRVQRNWARSFWRVPKDQESTPKNQEAQEEEEE